LWNTYRRETTAGSKKVSLLFGLLKYQSQPECGRRWRVLGVPLGAKTRMTTAPLDRTGTDGERTAGK
jgi:hypothetical protein